jgi:hypothetical protein
MSNLGILKSRIANELARGDLASEIAYAVDDAVKLYQARRFKFNQARATFSTVIGQEFYGTADGLPADIASIEALTLLVNGRKTVLEEWASDVIEHVSTTTNTESQSFAWAWFANQVRLYPIPDQAYPVTLSYTRRIDAPTADGDSNAWTGEAANLIRYAAKRMLAADVIKDDREAAVAAQSEAMELARLKRESQQLTTGGLRANW